MKAAIEIVQAGTDLLGDVTQQYMMRGRTFVDQAILDQAFSTSQLMRARVDDINTVENLAIEMRHGGVVAAVTEWEEFWNPVLNSA